jgi:hypothetical protein
VKYFVAFSSVLLLGGCLEAFDLVEEKLASPRYCHTPTATFLCEPPGQAVP